MYLSDRVAAAIQSFILNSDPVMHLIPVLDSPQYGNGAFHRRLFGITGLKPSLQSRIFSIMLPVLFRGSCPYSPEFPPRRAGLKDSKHRWNPLRRRPYRVCSSSMTRIISPSDSFSWITALVFPQLGSELLGSSPDQSESVCLYGIRGPFTLKTNYGLWAGTLLAMGGF